MKPKILITGALIGIGTIGAITDVHALNICMKKGSYVGVLKKSINGTNPTSDSTKKTWSATFDYTNVNGIPEKKITGTAACNEVNGTIGAALPSLKTTAADEGTHCWCMMFPVPEYNTYTGITSWYVLLKDDYATIADCADNCAANCASSVANNTNNFRAALFDAIQ